MEAGGTATSIVPMMVMAYPPMSATRMWNPPPHILSSVHDTDSPSALYSHVVIPRAGKREKNTMASHRCGATYGRGGSGYTVQGQGLAPLALRLARSNPMGARVRARC